MGEEKVEVESKCDTICEEGGEQNGEQLLLAKVDILGKVIAVEEVRDQECAHSEGERYGSRVSASKTIHSVMYRTLAYFDFPCTTKKMRGSRIEILRMMSVMV